MGDSGAMLLGLVLAVATVSGVGRNLSGPSGGDLAVIAIPILLPVFVLAVPFLDVVLAIARHRRRDLDAALDALDVAIARAEPEGYVRVFLDEGEPMTTLLRVAAKDRAYARRLLAAAASAPPQAASDGLVEPLSDRELDVLRLLQGDLSGPEIASELFVSVNTVRTHTKNIYAKLGVSTRRAAVHRGAALGLLPREGLPPA